MRGLIRAVMCAAIVSMLAAGSALAARPDNFVVDVSSPENEAETEAFLLEVCGYPIDFEASGHVIVHIFNGNSRLVEIDNYRLFETFSANGKTIVVRPDSGPDVVWVGADGALYLAVVGRSVTGSGVIGRTVINLDTFELVSSHGRELGDFFAILCARLAA